MYYNYLQTIEIVLQSKKEFSILKNVGDQCKDFQTCFYCILVQESMGLIDEYSQRSFVFRKNVNCLVLEHKCFS